MDAKRAPNLLFFDFGRAVQDKDGGESVPEQGQSIGEGELQGLLLARAPNLLAYLESKIPGRFRRVVSADDVLQEIWSAVFRGIATFRADGRPDAFDRWLRVITDHELSDALRPLRRKKRNIHRQISNRPQVYYSSLDDLVAVLASPCRTPSRESSLKEAKQAIRSAVDSLPDDQKQALTMQYVEGRPMSEIAKEMGRSERAVAGLIYRGRLGVLAQLGRARDYFTDASSEDAAG